MAKKTKKRHSKLLPKHHTGKLRAHKHTSYGALALILLVVSAPLLLLSHTVSASADESQGIFTTVPAPIPTTAPTIVVPKANQVFSTTQEVTVSGSCPAKTLVEVFKNQVMTGATVCQNGNYSVQIDLFAGGNSLIARAYNANSIPGPDSLPVSVLSEPPGVGLAATAALNANGIPANALYLTAQEFYRGSAAGQSTSWPMTISGGQAPYALSIGWGDGKTDLISRATPGQFTPSHTYAHAPSSGYDTIVVQATDQNGQTAYLQLVALISGKASGVTKVVGSGYSSSTLLRLAWQLLLLAIVLVIAFWLGEKREKRVLQRAFAR